MPIQVGFKIDAERGTDAFKRARRDFNKRMQGALERAGERAVLPDARRNAPSFVAPSLYVRVRGSTAFVTTRLRGKLARAAGLLHWGGTIRKHLFPRKARALFWPGASHPVAAVRGPRTIAPKLYLSRAVEGNRPKVDRVVLEEMLDAFKDAGLEVS
jgi:hypothetical protein